MTKPVTGLVQFGNSAGPDNTGDLDSNYAAITAAINDFATYSNYLTDTSGAANTIVLTTPASTTFALVAGIEIQFALANTTTSGSVNINVNALGSGPLINPDGSDPAVGQLVADGIYTAIYDGVHWQLQGNALAAANVALLNAANIFTDTNTFNPPAALASSVVINGKANAYGLSVNGSSTSGQSFGQTIIGGTTTADAALDVFDIGQTIHMLQLRGDGRIAGWGVTPAALVDMTPDTGTFNLTLTGCTTAPTAAASWTRIGKLVLLNIASATAVSNSTGFTLTGLPAVIQPASLSSTLFAFAENNGVATIAQAQVVAGSGTITLLLGGLAAGWNNAGAKGILGTTLAYLLE